MLFGAVGPRVFPQTDERLQAFEQLRMGRVKNRPANVQLSHGNGAADIGAVGRR
jgi:hypothetical protein